MGYICENFQGSMRLTPLKFALAAIFMAILLFPRQSLSFSRGPLKSSPPDTKEPKVTGPSTDSLIVHAAAGGFQAAKVIIGHVSDAHEWHFFTLNGHAFALPLPVILYVPKQGFSFFSSSRLGDGDSAYEGFRMLTTRYIQAQGLDNRKFLPGHIIAVKANGSPNLDKAVYDISLTKNTLQMMLSCLLMILIFTAMARKYARNPNRAPSGFQNALEPFVIFIRDDVARAYLGRHAEKYLAFLLTVFFFIWTNALLGLIPGSANVPGNIAFTGVLALITFVLIITSTNKHYWKHIFWPPGIPLPVKFILIPVEILGIFTKPFALMIRLFANMLAGHLIIISIISLIFIFGGMALSAGWGFSVVSVAFTVFMYFVELLVGLIQAFIFTSLSALFISQAFEGGNQDHQEVDPVIV